MLPGATNAGLLHTNHTSSAQDQASSGVKKLVHVPAQLAGDAMLRRRGCINLTWQNYRHLPVIGPHIRDRSRPPGADPRQPTPLPLDDPRHPFNMLRQ
jgi:hypothetical protein